jgi:hypothetical protein
MSDIQVFLTAHILLLIASLVRWRVCLPSFIGRAISVFSLRRLSFGGLTPRNVCWPVHFGKLKRMPLDYVFSV